MESYSKDYLANLDELPLVLEFFEELLSSRGARMKNIINFNIAVEEIFVNICHYAYEGRENLGCTINSSIDDEVVWVEFVDRGMPFNPLEKPDPDINADLMDRSVGGLGIYMVKKSMEDCFYVYDGGQNKFSFKKHFKN